MRSGSWPDAAASESSDADAAEAADQTASARAAAREKSPDTLVIVQADTGVAHGKVVEVMELAKGAGLAQLAIGVREGP